MSFVSHAWSTGARLNWNVQRVSNRSKTFVTASKTDQRAIKFTHLILLPLLPINNNRRQKCSTYLSLTTEGFLKGGLFKLPIVPYDLTYDSGAILLTGSDSLPI
jgi:hypothetical protein